MTRPNPRASQTADLIVIGQRQHCFGRGLDAAVAPDGARWHMSRWKMSLWLQDVDGGEREHWQNSAKTMDGNGKKTTDIQTWKQLSADEFVPVCWAAAAISVIELDI